MLFERHPFPVAALRVLLFVALLVCLGACEPRTESRPATPPEPTPFPSALSIAAEEPRVPPDAPAALIAWTSISPYDGAAEVLEKLIKGHNYLHPDRPAAMLYVDADRLAEEAAKGDALDLPPTLFFLPGNEVLDMAQKGLLAPVGEMAARAGVALDSLYPVALAGVTAEKHLWGLPFCGKMELRYVNADATGMSARRAGAWADFIAGKAGFCDASSDQLRGLTGNKQ